MTALDARTLFDAALAGGDPHLAAFLASARALSAEESEAQRRLMQRRMLGCCPCGLAPGDAYCPICEGHMGQLGRDMREEGKTLAEITESERQIVAAATKGGHEPGELVDLTVMLNARFGAEREARALREAARRAALTKFAAAACAPVAPEWRPMNRQERRAERSRRRRG